MTDIPHTSNTHTAPLLNSVTTSTSTSSSTPNGSVRPPPVEEEEPYTIKCICDFQEDDGKTIFCEHCDTWQHTACYYPDGKVPGEFDPHSCVDCEPRVLDKKHATEHQRNRREQQLPGDRKPKRPNTKSHKRKPKEGSHSGHVNGYDKQDSTDRRAGSPRDQPPPAKKPKSNHIRGSSISSQLHNKQSPSLVLGDRKVAAPRYRSTSPSKSPQDAPNGVHYDMYSPEFLRLYREDPGKEDTPGNIFSIMRLINDLHSWIQDEDACEEATHGFSPREVFQRLDRPLENLVPSISRLQKEDFEYNSSGHTPLWQYLAVDSFVPEGGVVGELKGCIGYVEEYRQDPANRWAFLKHPAPFVFFHPRLPIYIDTRKEGSRCRYIRRSCRPNASMKSLVANGTECHFCFHASEELQPGQEVTIAWDLDEYTRECLKKVNPKERSTPMIKAETLSDAEYESMSSWVCRLLANFGGCACGSPKACMFAPFDLRSPSTQPLTNGVKPKKGRKGKHHSPLSTGQATNSRAGSEGLNQRDRDDDQDDSRSTSDSIRSNPARDLTPSTHYSTDNMQTATGGPELSDREKRKIAAAERNFEQLDHQAQRKKKRPSGGSNSGTPGVGQSVRSSTSSAFSAHANVTMKKQLGHSQPSTPATSSRPQYINAGTSNRMSGSPTSASPTKFSPHAMSSTFRPNYVDASCQTDPEEDAWYKGQPSPKSRKPFVPLAKRLLQKCHEERLQLAEDKKRKASEEMEMEAERRPSKRVVGAVSSPAVVQDPVTSTWIKEPSQPPLEDVVMQDVSVLGSTQPALEANTQLSNSANPPPQAIPKPISAPIKPPPPPWTTSTTTPSTSPDDTKPRILSNGHRAVDLHVQLPPHPSFAAGGATTPSVTSTPTSATATSPFTSGPNGPNGPLLSGNMSMPSPALPQQQQQQQPHFSPAIPTNVVTPVKKMSFSDYVSRKHKAETPSLAQTQALEREGRGILSLREEEKPEPVPMVKEESRGEDTDRRLSS
ncbi:MAG: hypothetical protein M1824_003926 [Vezdaea acicularis]|nr:MAG: hypothetical protein M1824_003926 [Vezdaea acicularis]